MGMILCWSCHGPGRGEPFCSTCGLIQPPPRDPNYYGLFGLPLAFRLDRELLDHRYREAQQRFHPDRFVTRSPTERRLSLEWVTLLNEAYHDLKDPMLRGRYLLKRLGEPMSGESGGPPSDPTLLLEVMELREEMAQVDVTHPEASHHLDRLRLELERRIREDESALALAFDRHQEQRNAAHLAQAAGLIDRLRYDLRMREALEEIEEKLFEV